MKECLIIAGEKSGEEHTLSFYKDIENNIQDVHFFGVGGDELKSAGMELIYNLKDFSTWGISQAIKKLPFYKKAFKRIVDEVERRNCKVAILVDYQTFNLKLAEKLGEKGVKILYYVAPQAWAWKEWRVKSLEKNVHTLFSIIPFEKKWFKERGVSKVVTVEHPLLKHYKEDLATYSKESTEVKNILLLPGSRNFEVKSLLPEFVKTVRKIKENKNVKVSIVKSSSVNTALYEPYDSLFDKVYTNEQITDALKEADFSFASSGTVNLTCALYQVPTVVGYTGTLLNEFIYYTFVSYRGFISLANIVHDSEIFPEFIGERVSDYNFFKAYERMTEPKRYREIVKQLGETKDVISGEELNVASYMSDQIKEAYEV